MLVIALTGGIGSGKSTVSDLFKLKGIPVIDTDIIARQLVEKGKPAYQEIVHEFGKDILTSANELNRQKLRQIVFTSDKKRLQLEKILHPKIWDEVRKQLSLAQSPYCIVVVPLLFENKSNINEVNFDRILVIDINKEQQIERVVKRDNCDEQIIQKIITSQVSRQTRLDSADEVIQNMADRKSLKSKIDELHQKYLNLSSEN